MISESLEHRGGSIMLRISTEHNRSLAVGLFFICLILILFTLGVDALFPYYNPLVQNILLSQIIPPTGYLGSTVNPLNQNGYSQNFSYNDYYDAYPYLQLQNLANPYYGSATGTNTVNNTNNYAANSVSYTTGFQTQINNPSLYSTYQSVNTYPRTNYSPFYSSPYQTPPIYPNTGIQPKTAYQQYDTYSQFTGNYIPGVQTGYYSPATSQGYTSYPVSNYYQTTGYTQNQSNTYIPANSYNQYIPIQTNYTGYYVPNANYWPNVEIAEPETPADIEGEYRGEWVSETTGEDGEICAEIEQTDAQADGSIKLKEFVISAEGKAAISGTVAGDTVSLQIDLDGPILEFEGTVQSNGDIVGSYTIEGSSGTILDQGTLTLEPK